MDVNHVEKIQIRRRVDVLDSYEFLTVTAGVLSLFIAVIVGEIPRIEMVHRYGLDFLLAGVFFWCTYQINCHVKYLENLLELKNITSSKAFDTWQKPIWKIIFLR